MKRLFKKGDRVKRTTDGRVMEVIKYMTNTGNGMVECIWFDLEKKEMRKNLVRQDKLLRAS